MPVFEFETVDKAGALGRGTLQADDQDHLLQTLRERGQLVVSVRAAGGRGAASSSGVLTQGFKGARQRVKLSTLVLFTGQLAAMLEAGIHLVRILTAIARESVDKRFATILEDVRNAIASGSSFADALAKYPRVFSTLYVAVVRAGEVSGALSVVLQTLTTSLEKAEILRRKVKGALAYPVVILAVAVLIVAAMLIFIVPIFEGVYGGANVKLPLPTRVLIAVSHFVRGYVLFILLGLVALGIGLRMAARTIRGREIFDGLKLRVPIFGHLIRRAVVARTCRTLSLLIQSGIPLMEALEIATRVAGNRVIEMALEDARRGVREGGTLADMMRQTGQFPSLVTQLVSSGEESGSLALMLGKAATYYEQQVDASVATLSTLIEPIMIVIMGIIAGSIILALYMPIFTLGQAMRGGIK